MGLELGNSSHLPHPRSLLAGLACSPLPISKRVTLRHWRIGMHIPGHTKWSIRMREQVFRRLFPQFYLFHISYHKNSIILEKFIQVNRKSTVGKKSNNDILCFKILYI